MCVFDEEQDIYMVLKCLHTDGVDYFSACVLGTHEVLRTYSYVNPGRYNWVLGVLNKGVTFHPGSRASQAKGAPPQPSPALPPAPLRPEAGSQCGDVVGLGG